MLHLPEKERGGREERFLLTQRERESTGAERRGSGGMRILREKRVYFSSGLQKKKKLYRPKKKETFAHQEGRRTEGSLRYYPFAPEGKGANISPPSKKG